MLTRIVTLIFVFTIFSSLSAQKLEETKIGNLDPGFIIGFSYGVNLPGGDLANRFGQNFKVDITPTYYFYNSNLSIGIEASYIFGTKIKDNPLSNLFSYDDQIISVDNSFASLYLSERGAMLGGLISKIIPLNSNRRSGIRLELGAYAFRHWINYKTELGTIPQLQDEYVKGYDRLTGGFSVKEFIGYQYLKRDNKVSFYAGVEFVQGFTKSLREFNYNLAQYDTNKRKDYLFGFKFGWILPIYISKNPEEIYY